MDIMELGAVGELVGGVAVIATLVYLAAQIRQNTRAAMADAEIAASAAMRGLVEKFVTAEIAKKAP